MVPPGRGADAGRRSASARRGARRAAAAPGAGAAPLSMPFQDAGSSDRSSHAGDGVDAVEQQLHVRQRGAAFREGPLHLTVLRVLAATLDDLEKTRIMFGNPIAAAERAYGDALPTCTRRSSRLSTPSTRRTAAQAGVAAPPAEQEIVVISTTEWARRIELPTPGCDRNGRRSRHGSPVARPFRVHRLEECRRAPWRW